MAMVMPFKPSSCRARNSMIQKTRKGTSIKSAFGLIEPASAPREQTAQGVGHGRSSRFGLPGFFAAFVDRHLFVQARDHLANSRLGEPLESDRMALLQLNQSLFQVAEFFLGLLIFRGVGDHNSISTSPLQRPSASRVLLKNSIQ